MAVEGARQIFEARQSLAEFFGINDCERLIFTPGCTASINMVLKGLCFDAFFKNGDRVVVSSLEHNSVMRPLEQLRKFSGIAVEIVPGGGDFMQRFQKSLDAAPPRMVVLNWASNVTGEILPIDSAARLCKERRIPLLVDAAQVAGKLPIDLRELPGISFLSVSGHKGLMGPPGIGLLFVDPDYNLSPLIAGGTGSRSESFAVPAAYPDHLEAGTQAGPCIAGLHAGVQWLREETMEAIMSKEMRLAQRFLAWASESDAAKVYGPVYAVESTAEEARLPIVSFTLAGLTAAELADVLDTKYGIATRAGLHCSSLCHKSLGTLEGGLVRASFGPFNQEAEVDALCQALAAISKESCVR